MFCNTFCSNSINTMFWLILLAVVSAFFYYKAIKPLYYWSDRGIAHVKPLPIFGNFGSVALRRIAIFNQLLIWYNQFSKERYFGIHQFLQPSLMIRDVDLIKQITVKDHEFFIDHNNLLTEEVEPLMSKNLFNLKGQRWRDMRATLSPTFTSSKMKMMFSLISKCAHEFAQFLEKHNNQLKEIEIKDFFTRFTNDVIASIAFGLKCNSLEDEHNIFYTMGKKITKFEVTTFFTMYLSAIFPKLAKFLDLRLIPKPVADFFTTVIDETIKKRENEQLVRLDMIHLLMEARKEQLKNVGAGDGKLKLTLSDEDITAQALIFFFAGFESTAGLMTFISYELALNPNIQDHLRREIDETLNDCNGVLTYEALNKMRYMDMVVSETLRKWPIGFMIDRLCVKDYTIEPVNPWEKHVTIEKGTVIQIPIVGLHRDPKYFPDPDKFDPERFSEDNKHNIESFTYLPFGSGPRICIASRFALLESKVLLFHLLAKFALTKIDRTLYPMEVGKQLFNIVPPNGVWLGIRPRTS